MEKWKQIEHDGIKYNYEVSTEGKVRNMKTGRIMAQSDNGRGFLYVVLKKKSFRVNRLVAIAFIPNPDNLPEVNHKNENKHDNRVENLEWCNRKYNATYGTIKEKQAKAHYKRVKATHKKTGEVLYFDSITQASTELDLFHSNICACLRGTKKSCGGYLWEYVD